jgi:hypothetical protein
VDEKRAEEIGRAMRARALQDHTYEQRAHEVESILLASRAERHPSNVVEEEIAPLENIA